MPTLWYAFLVFSVFSAVCQYVSGCAVVGAAESTVKASVRLASWKQVTVPSTDRLHPAGNGRANPPASRCHTQPLDRIIGGWALVGPTGVALADGNPHGSNAGAAPLPALGAVAPAVALAPLPRPL